MKEARGIEFYNQGLESDGPTRATREADASRGATLQDVHSTGHTVNESHPTITGYTITIKKKNGGPITCVRISWVIHNPLLWSALASVASVNHKPLLHVSHAATPKPRCEKFRSAPT